MFKYIPDGLFFHATCIELCLFRLHQHWTSNKFILGSAMWKLTLSTGSTFTLRNILFSCITTQLQLWLDLWWSSLGWETGAAWVRLNVEDMCYFKKKKKHRITKSMCTFSFSYLLERITSGHFVVVSALEWNIHDKSCIGDNNVNPFQCETSVVL